jgi:two-component system chemotaxis response regulator CheY
MPTMLVADDAPFIREIVRALAQKSGIALIGEAANGHEAVEQALAKRPDVILMDIIMPLMSGIEATKEILKQIPDARIIAFTTADEEILAARALDAGCRSFLAKPFSAEDLLNAVRASLGTRP